MRLFVCCSQEGNVISAMKVNVMVEGLEHPYGELREGEMVLEIEPTAEIEALDCHEICERYVVDVESKRLKPKEDKPPRRSPRRRTAPS